MKRLVIGGMLFLLLGGCGVRNEATFSSPENEFVRRDPNATERLYADLANEIIEGLHDRMPAEDWEPPGKSSFLSCSIGDEDGDIVSRGSYIYKGNLPVEEWPSARERIVEIAGRRDFHLGSSVSPESFATQMLDFVTADGDTLNMVYNEGSIGFCIKSPCLKWP